MIRMQIDFLFDASRKRMGEGRVENWKRGEWRNGRGEGKEWKRGEWKNGRGKTRTRKDSSYAAISNGDIGQNEEIISTVSRGLAPLAYHPQNTLNVLHQHMHRGLLFLSDNYSYALQIPMRSH